MLQLSLISFDFLSFIFCNQIILEIFYKDEPEKRFFLYLNIFPKFLEIYVVKKKLSDRNIITCICGHVVRLVKAIDQPDHMMSVTAITVCLFSADNPFYLLFFT